MSSFINLGSNNFTNTRGIKRQRPSSDNEENLNSNNNENSALVINENDQNDSESDVISINSSTSNSTNSSNSSSSSNVSDSGSEEEFEDVTERYWNRQVVVPNMGVFQFVTIFGTDDSCYR